MSCSTALTIGGSDPSGGAGIQADLKTFHQHGVYGTSVLTLVTVQNTRGVAHIAPLDADLVASQLTAVLDDIPPRAIKTGALGQEATVARLAGILSECGIPLVIDPVLASTGGRPLLEAHGLGILKSALLPLAVVVTPNIPEAEALSGMSISRPEEMETAARRIAALGPRHVLIKGGHLPGEALDVLWSDGRLQRCRHPRLATRHTHGTGCVLSAAITARLARGAEPPEAVLGAQAFVQRALAAPPGLGRGHGPLNLHVPADP